MGAESTIGRQLAQQLNMEFYDSDQEIERNEPEPMWAGLSICGWAKKASAIAKKKVINELPGETGHCAGYRRRLW